MRRSLRSAAGPGGPESRGRGRSSQANLDVAKARGGGAMRYVHGLPGLALAAVEHAPEMPRITRADRIEVAPELRRDAGVGRVAQHARAPAVLDLPCDLGAEL